jgi:hypothetical protein
MSGSSSAPQHPRCSGSTCGNDHLINLQQFVTDRYCTHGISNNRFTMSSKKKLKFCQIYLVCRTTAECS